MIEISDVNKKIQDEFQQIKSSIKKPNIMLIGCTGVGKSSLINECFGQTLALAKAGRPVTQHIDSFTSDDVPVVLYDTKGYEIGSSKEHEFINDVVDFASKSQGDDNAIHMVWYCIQASGGRIVDFDVSTIKKLMSCHIPVAIVLTKAELISDEEAIQFRRAINSLITSASIFETSSKNNQREWDLEKLCLWSIEQLPEALKIGFAVAQRKNLDIKKIEAYSVVKQHSAGAAGIGFIPVPFSDAPVLILNQIGMITRILYIFNMQSYSNIIGTVVIKSIIGPLLARSGIWAVGQLIKFIPGLGTAAGGIINATVATSITYAFGASVIELCTNIYKHAIDGNLKQVNELLEKAAPFLQEQFSKNYK